MKGRRNENKFCWTSAKHFFSEDIDNLWSRILKFLTELWIGIRIGSVPYSLCCLIRIQNLNSVPDKSVIKGYNFVKSHHKNFNKKLWLLKMKQKFKRTELQKWSYWFWKKAGSVITVKYWIQNPGFPCGSGSSNPYVRRMDPTTGLQLLTVRKVFVKYMLKISYNVWPISSSFSL